MRKIVIIFLVLIVFLLGLAQEKSVPEVLSVEEAKEHMLGVGRRSVVYQDKFEIGELEAQKLYIDDFSIIQPMAFVRTDVENIIVSYPSEVLHGIDGLLGHYKTQYLGNIHHPKKGCLLRIQFTSKESIVSMSSSCRSSLINAEEAKTTLGLSELPKLVTGDPTHWPVGYSPYSSFGYIYFAGTHAVDAETGEIYRFVDSGGNVVDPMTTELIPELCEGPWHKGAGSQPRGRPWLLRYPYRLETEN